VTIKQNSRCKASVVCGTQYKKQRRSVSGACVGCGVTPADDPKQCPDECYPVLTTYGLRLEAAPPQPECTQ